MKFRVIGIGEVLWDLLPSGPQLGGAPANFACHCRQLGAESQVISRVGTDDRGKRALECFHEMETGAGTVQLDENLPTGTASVVLDGHGSPHFTIHESVAWDALALTPEAMQATRNSHAICFGTLAQRTPAAAFAIQQLVANTPFNALRVFDINLRQGFYSPEILERSLKAANVLKLNSYELETLTPLFGLSGSVEAKIEQLAQGYELQLVALTRAERGSLLFRRGNWSELPGRKFEVVDTVGAGDAFAAGLVMGLLHQFPLDDIHQIAGEIARFVCSCRGANPPLPQHLRSAFTERRVGARGLQGAA